MKDKVDHSGLHLVAVTATQLQPNITRHYTSEYMNNFVFFLHAQSGGEYVTKSKSGCYPDDVELTSSDLYARIGKFLSIVIRKYFYFKHYTTAD